MAFRIPKPLKSEHEELHGELAAAAREPGHVGEAARIVAKLLHPHFVKEEEYALPPLGLLALAAAGKINPEMRSALPMTDKLKAELPAMLDEHRAIVAALSKLKDAAQSEGMEKYAQFADKLLSHAQTEEEVLYPAAIVLGEYLKSKLT